MDRYLNFVIICLFLLSACTGAQTPTALQEQLTQLSAGKTIVAEKLPKPLFGNIILLVMENVDLSSAQKEPYFQELMQQYAYTRNYSALTHPSLPNHVGLISGDTFGFKRDCEPGPDCHIPGAGINIADELEAAGLTWKAYLEAMPEPCTTKSTDKYLVRHNPFIFFDSIRNDRARCTAHDLPFTQFKTDLETGALPNFAWVIPDKCHGMHSKCNWFKSRLSQGEDWLSTWIPKILASKQFQSEGLLIITFDEGEGAAGINGTEGGGRVLTLVISPNPITRSGGWASDIAYNHYSVLRTIEDNWGLAHLGHSGDEDILPMLDFFKVTK